MRYLDVCAGISASTVAWKPLDWKAAAYSEIEAAPRAILAHHYPDTPLHGDFTTIKGDEYGPIDLLVGGTPCQDFSIAGLRAGLAGDRGNLSLQFLLLARRTRARWVVWENVPGGPGSLDDRETYIVEGDHPRHMTPREIERCFGFPDDYTLVPYRKGTMADGPRYKALGNSMAVPVMRWIGERIAAVEALAEAAASDAAVRSAA
jgi:site-specific DNA-cytosine methylase